MSDTSHTEAAPENSHKKVPSVLRSWNSPHSIALAALAIALIAVAVAVAAWLRPVGASHSFSDQQSAQAKTNVCSAYKTVRRAVFDKPPAPPHPDDPVANLAVSTHARMAFLGGGSYLTETVAAEPATPADLAKAVKSMANTLEKIGMTYLAREGKAAQDPLRKDLGNESRELNKMCAPNTKR